MGPHQSQQANKGLGSRTHFPCPQLALLLTLSEEGFPVAGLCSWGQPCPAGLQTSFQRLQVGHRCLEEARLHDGDTDPKGSHVPPRMGAEGGPRVLVLWDTGGGVEEVPTDKGHEA